jgi:alpha-tubulin suppressor-like RCC1 family protein
VTNAASIAHRCAPGALLVAALTLMAACRGDSGAGPAPSDGLRFRSLAAAGQTACGVATDGGVRCWGANDGQLLGRGSAAGTDDPVPTPIAGVGEGGSVSLNPAASLACAVAAPSGDVYCWGYTPFASTDRPTKVAGLSGTAAIAAGGSQVSTAFACGAMVSGEVACFGGDGAENVSDGTGSGQLGTGIEPQGPFRYPPRVILGGFAFRSVVAGERHACGLTSAGAAYCWGSNRASQLGTEAATGECRTRAGSRFYDTWPCSGTPVPVGGGLAFVRLSAGLRVTCGLAADGAGYCWGAGMGATPTRVLDGAALRDIAVSAEGRYCVVTSTGRVTCVGRNDRGQGGDAETAAGIHRLESSLDFARLAVADDFTCGITTGGEAWCWGSDARGQLGVPPAAVSCPQSATPCSVQPRRVDAPRGA